jgi:adenylate cyclase
MSQTRRLAAILAADVAGYSRLMGADEEGTLARLKAIRRELGDPKIKEHRGRIVKTTGDGVLVEFPSVVDAVRCAVEVQREMAARDAEVPEALRIEFRMGINLGDIIKDGRDIYGDGVNIAARLEALAEPGGICVSRVVRDQVRDKLASSFEDMGEQEVKNIARPVRVHRIVLGEGAGPSGLATGTSTKSPLTLPDKPSLAVLPFQNMSGDPEQEYFADGMVEEIITALSRIRRLLGAHHRPADRRDDRRAYLCRPFRWRARRHLRPAGPGGQQCRRGDRAQAPEVRDRASGPQTHR